MKSVFKKHRISLRQKVIALIFITLAVLTSYALYFTLVTAHHAVEEELIENAQIAVNLISGAISGALWRKEATFLQEFVKQALSGRNIQYIRFVDREGVVLAEGGKGRGHIKHLENEGLSGDLRGDKSLLWTHRMDLVKGTPIVQEVGKAEGLLHRSGHVFFVCRSVTHEGQDAGEIHMGINTMVVNRRLALATYWGITIFILTALSGALFTYFLEGRMRDSLKELIQTTRRMAGGDLAQRVRIDIGDEVQELGESFNQMAEALAGKEKELTISRNTMVSIFNGITAGIAYISRDYSIIYKNHAYEAMQRETAGSSLKGLKCFELLWQMQGVCKDCPGNDAMKTGKSEALEREIILKTGERRVLRIHAYPVQDTGQQPTGFVEYIMDITPQRKLEDELKIYTGHLEEIAQEKTRKLQEAQTQIVHQEKMAALGQIVAGVAHEINNPNSFITYNIPLLEETWQMFEPLVSEHASANPEKRISGFSIEELCGDMRGLIKDIKIGSDRINKIISNLKDFARQDDGTQVAPVQVNEMIEKTMAIVGTQVRKSVGKVKMDLAPDLPRIQGHFQKLEQVMANLIMNAVHAIPDKDEGRLSVTTRYVARLGSVLIEVEDNGIGMERGVIERIFEPFFTTKRDVGGTGLGLSVTYGLVQEHNGKIGVLSRPGLGTRFTLYFPVNSEKKLGIRPSILCLDDVGFMSLLRKHFDEVKNMPIDTKKRPEAVVEYLLNHPEVDIVLSEMMTPGTNGWELIEQIKGRFPLLTVIAYSGHPNVFKQRPESASPPDHFLQKPFEIERLLEIINSTGRQRL